MFLANLRSLSYCLILLLLFVAAGLSAQPTITSYTPGKGAIGSTVTITGTGFNATPANNIVYFGTVKAAVTSASTTSLQVTVPAGANYAPITVTVAGLTAFTKPFDVTFTGAGILAPGSFSGSSMSQPGDPQGIASGDIDGDGKAELVVYNKSAKTITVFRNSSTAGSIAVGTTYTFATPASSEPAGVAVADFDGDGKLDVFVSINGQNASFFRNTSTTGTPQFATRLDIASFTNCSTSRQQVTIADLDRDGKPDIILSCAIQIAVRRNTSTAGNISFAPVITVPVKIGVNQDDGNAMDIVAADFDADGKEDIAACIYDLGKLAVFRNTTTTGISFAAAVDFPANSLLYSIGAADLDEDGKPEVFIGNSDMTNGASMSLYRNTSTSGNISFDPKVDYSAGYTVFDIATGDFDGDGHVDVVGARQGDGKLSLHRNISTTNAPAFAATVDLDAQSQLYALTMPDLDNDGKVDIATVHTNSSNAVMVFRNKINEPTISSFTPTSAGAGVTIVINGAQFVDVTEVMIGGVAAASYTVDSPTKISAVVASGAADGIVKVTTPTGVASKSGYIFIPPPTITNFTPTTGIVGTTITITGTVFTGASAVTIGGVPATFSVASATSITAVVNSATSGNVVVTTPGGTVTAAGFVGIPGPKITTLNPVSGPPGTSIQITGTGFSATAADNLVSFGGIKITPSAATATSLTVASPGGIASSDLSVTTNKLGAWKTQAFVPTFASQTGLKPSSFIEESSISIPTNASIYAAGDFNRDGKQDVVLLRRSTTSLTIFPNQTETTDPISFGATITPTILTANSVAIGDVDNDGAADIVVLNINFSFSIFRNTSSGAAITFATRQDFPGSYGYKALLADLDGDGRLDIITMGYFQTDGYRVTVYRNITSATGTINFQAGQQFNVVENPSDLAVGDLDGDGKPDVVAVTNGDPGKVMVLRNTSTEGAISLAPRTEMLPSMKPYFAQIQDMNGDGKLDLVLTDESRAVNVFQNASTIGSIVLNNAANMMVNDLPEELLIGPVDGDAIPDIIVVQAGKKFSVFRYNGSGGTMSYETQMDYGVSVNGEGGLLADLNNDGRMDLVISSNQAQEKVIIVRNAVPDPYIASFTPVRAPTGATVTITGENFTGTTAVSFGGVAATSFTVESGTTIKAIVGAGATGDVSVTTPLKTVTSPGFVLYNGPTITSISPKAAAPGATVTITGTGFGSSNTVWFGAVKANITSASSTEIVVAVPKGATYGPISVTTNELIGYSRSFFNPRFDGGSLTSQSFATKFDFAAGDGPEGIAVADFDLDGKPDLAVVNNNNTVSVLRNKSTTDPSFESPLTLDAGSVPIAITTGDFDMDGKPDIAVTNSSGNSISVFRNASVAGSMSFQLAVDYTVGTNPQSIAVGDFDADGRPDIVTGNFTSAATVSILRNTTTTSGISFAAKVDAAAGSFPIGVAVADMGGDARPDIVVANLNADNVSILINKSLGTSIVFEAPANQFGSLDAPGAVAVLDVGSDDAFDFVATETDENKAQVFKKSGSIYSSTAYNTSGYPYSVTVGDVNGDGRPDIVTANAGAGVNNLTIIGGTDIGFTGKTDVAAGTEPIGVVICDFDGDGRADLASANRSSKNVSVMANRSPTILDFTPKMAGAGTTITITGTNLASTTGVKFGGIAAATFTVVSPTTITAVVGSGGTGVVEVTMPGLILTATGFTFFQKPSITSFTPNTGSPGTVITITGSALTGTSSVKIGGVAAASFTQESSTTVKAVVSEGGASGVITLENPGGVATSSASFTFIGPPVIDSFTPDKGGPGSTITITGQYLQGATSVLFGGTAATSFTSTSNTTVTAVVGGGATGIITVVTPVGTATKSGFTYDPTVTGVNDGPGDGLTIYPNPFDGRSISIDMPASFIDKPTTLRLVDMTGREVGALDVIARQTIEWRVNEVQPLKSGIYVLRIASGRVVVMKKAVVSGE